MNTAGKRLLSALLIMVFAFAMVFSISGVEGLIDNDSIIVLGSDGEVSGPDSDGEPETVVQKAGTMTVKAKTVTVKYSKVKKKDQTIKASKAFSVKNKQGKVTYKKKSGNKKITVSSSGKIKLKKGLKKGTYKVKVKVTDAGNDEYKSKSKTVTVKIKVK